MIKQKKKQKNKNYKKTQQQTDRQMRVEFFNKSILRVHSLTLFFIHFRILNLKRREREREITRVWFIGTRFLTWSDNEHVSIAALSPARSLAYRLHEMKIKIVTDIRVWNRWKIVCNQTAIQLRLFPPFFWIAV